MGGKAKVGNDLIRGHDRAFIIDRLQVVA
jgi:hypothetical protein